MTVFTAATGVLVRQETRWLVGKRRPLHSGYNTLSVFDSAATCRACPDTHNLWKHEFIPALSYDGRRRSVHTPTLIIATIKSRVQLRDDGKRHGRGEMQQELLSSVRKVVRHHVTCSDLYMNPDLLLTTNDITTSTQHVTAGFIFQSTKTRLSIDLVDHIVWRWCLLVFPLMSSGCSAVS